MHICLSHLSRNALQIIYTRIKLRQVVRQLFLLLEGDINFS